MTSTLFYQYMIIKVIMYWKNSHFCFESEAKTILQPQSVTMRHCPLPSRLVMVLVLVLVLVPIHKEFHLLTPPPAPTWVKRTPSATGATLISSWRLYLAMQRANKG